MNMPFNSKPSGISRNSLRRDNGGVSLGYMQVKATTRYMTYLRDGVEADNDLVTGAWEIMEQTSKLITRGLPRYDSTEGWILSLSQCFTYVTAQLMHQGQLQQDLLKRSIDYLSEYPHERIQQARRLEPRLDSMPNVENAELGRVYRNAVEEVARADDRHTSTMAAIQEIADAKKMWRDFEGVHL